MNTPMRTNIGVGSAARVVVLKGRTTSAADCVRTLHVRHGRRDAIKPLRSAGGVVPLRPHRRPIYDLSEADGRDRYDRNLGIEYEVKSAINRLRGVIRI